MDDEPETTVAYRTRNYSINAPKIRRLADFICANLGVAGQELSINLVGSAHIRRLNREFRGIDKATDVLSFPQQEWSKPVRVLPRPAPTRRKPFQALGDIVISLPEAERNARAIGQGLDREVGFLMVHGILHLCGHDHMNPAEERRMLTAQRQIMQRLDRAKSGPLWHRVVGRRRGTGR